MAARSSISTTVVSFLVSALTVLVIPMIMEGLGSMHDNEGLGVTQMIEPFKIGETAKPSCCDVVQVRLAKVYEYNHILTLGYVTFECTSVATDTLVTEIIKNGLDKSMVVFWYDERDSSWVSESSPQLCDHSRAL